MKQAGKVREFGVSNFRPSEVAFLQKACPMRLAVHQVEISLANRTCLDDGTLDQCQAEGMTPLAWSPLAGGLLGDGAHRLLPLQEAYRTEAVVSALDKIAQRAWRGPDSCGAGLAPEASEPDRPHCRLNRTGTHPRGRRRRRDGSFPGRVVLVARSGPGRTLAVATRIGESRRGGLSQFSFDENGTVPL